MNKRRIADLAQEWNEVIERLDQDNFLTWLLHLLENQQIFVTKQLAMTIIFLFSDYLAIPKKYSPIWGMDENAGGAIMTQERKDELDQQLAALRQMGDEFYRSWFKNLTSKQQSYVMEQHSQNQQISEKFCKSKKLRVLVVEPEKRPYEKEIAPGLESLQREVGGYIETYSSFAEPVAIIIDEEGKINGKPLNRTLRDENGTIREVFAGTFLVVGLGADDFVSLTPELSTQFFNKFYTPEMFVTMGDRLLALPMEPQQGPPLEVYPHSARYAAEHGELARYQASARENNACVKAIEQAIRDNYKDYHLDPAGARAVLKKFGKERVQFVLALTIQHKQGDGRISPENKSWSCILNMPEGSELYQDTTQFAVNQAHPGLLDLFTTQTRSLIAQKERGAKKQSQRDR